MGKRLKTVEVFRTRDATYLRFWQYAGRGGKALAHQVRLKDGESPAQKMKSPEIQAMLRETFEQTPE